MSNSERQRQFQRRHPGYDARRKARQRDIGKRVQAQYIARRQAEWQAHLRAHLPVIPVPTWRLALPAPVESPATAALTQLPALLAATRERERMAA